MKPIAGDPPEQPDVEHDGDGREDDGLIPMQEGQEERSGSKGDVDPLPQRFRILRGTRAHWGSRARCRRQYVRRSPSVSSMPMAGTQPVSC